MITSALGQIFASNIAIRGAVKMNIARVVNCVSIMTMTRQSMRVGINVQC